jgi:hypothetical protein
MDSHFNEYLAAVAGMQEVYGHQADDHPTEFHDTDRPPADGHPLVAAAVVVGQERPFMTWRT